ncbi:hypothetical protein HYE58_00005 [Aggregatibacter actinomycetemcomitans]|nr:hypothetical protein [Aggregatibacter actinomycetemcomitans]
MEYTQSMRNRAFASKSFPREALYLFDELDNFLTKKHGILIGKNYPAIICNIILDFHKNEYLKCARKEAQKDVLIYNAAFVGNTINPNIEQIEKFIPNLKFNPPHLSNIAINVISESKKYQELKNLLGYELMALIAYFFLGMASKVTDFEYVRASFGKMTTYKKIAGKQTKNSNLSIKYCFQASEAIMIAKTLYFEQKHRNLVETAKYLIERAQKIAIQETTEKVTRAALANNAQKALSVRHNNNRKMKDQLLKEFDLYALQQREKG